MSMTPDLKPPARMSPKHLASNEVMLVSHPGWSRCSFNPKYAGIFEKFKTMYNRDVASRVELTSSFNQAFSDLQLFKDLVFITKSYQFLLEELMVESALEFAKKKNIPVIITLPGKSNSDAFQCNEYINHHYSRAYALPTDAGHGTILNSGSCTAHDAREFHRTPKGRELFGEYLDNKRTLYVAGGSLGACLDTTLLYFDHQKISLMDDWIYQNQQCDASENQQKVILDNLLDLHNLCTEQKARKEILDAFSTEQRAQKSQALQRLAQEHGAERITN